MKHRILALILALALVLTLCPATTLAVSVPGSSGTGTSGVHTNPLYPNLTAPEHLSFPHAAPGIEPTATSDYGTVEEAGGVIREYLKDRAGNFTIHFSLTIPNGTNAVDAINAATDVALAHAMRHTGEPTEGDYLQWQWGYWETMFSWSSSGTTYYVDMDFAFQYYTTAAQEAEMDIAVRNLLQELDLGRAGDYAKVCTIYDYLCDNITYDYDNLNNQDYKLKFTAYAALINRTAVCQGYAVLLYRLALELGVDARVVVGIGNGGPHAWNIIELKNLYYNADSTWDAGTNGNYSCFLVCEDNFHDHYRDEAYDTPEFHAEYPMDDADYVHTGDPEPTEPEPTEPPHSHIYLPTVFEPTCVDQGYTVYTCSCGDSYVADHVDPLGHEYGPWTTVKAPTCEEQGLEERECTRCGGYGEVRYPEALGHTWDNGTVTKEPTETQEGIRTFTCTRCGETRTEPIPALNPQPTEPEPTEPEPTEPEPTEPQPTDPEPTEPDHSDHAHVEEIRNATEATCEGFGYTGDIYCTICGKLLQQGEQIFPIGHSYGPWQIIQYPSGDGGLKVRFCTVCGAEEQTGVIYPETPHPDGYPIHLTHNDHGIVDLSITQAIPGHQVFMDIYPASGYKVGYIYYGTDAEVCQEPVQYGDYICFIMPEGELYIEVIFLPYESPFDDVSEKDYFYVPVLWALDNGVTSGVSANRFGPNNACTRAQVVMFLWRAAGSPEPVSYDNPFTDVKETDYFYKAVLWAVENGITSGMSPTRFGSHNVCTRAQVVTFLWAALGRPEPTTTSNPFTDVKETDYFYKAVLFAVEYGITSGMSATRFGSHNTCTRAHVVTFLYKTVG